MSILQHLTRIKYYFAVWNKVYDLRIKVRNEGEIGEYEFASDDN